MAEPVYRRGYRNLYGRPGQAWRFVGTVPSGIIIEPVCDANAVLVVTEAEAILSQVLGTASETVLVAKATETGSSVAARDTAQTGTAQEVCI